MKHTPGPWRVEGELDNLRIVADSDSPQACDGVEQIALVKCGDYELTHYARPAANAEFIVRACNAHANLLAALENILEANPELSEVADEARAAIAKASPPNV
jgi:hypothetical protein